MTLADLTSALNLLAEEKYRRFAASLIPGEDDLLGVRLPALRKLAQQAAREDWHTLFRALADATCMELVMIRGMLPGYAPHSTFEERLSALAEFVPSIRNWSICDSCCSTWKFVRARREEALDFLRPYILSEREYEARFGVVMLLNHYVKEDAWVAAVATLLPKVRCHAFYACMAVAWCACELYLHHPETAATVLLSLPTDTHSLAIRKIRESRRHPRPPQFALDISG